MKNDLICIIKICKNKVFIYNLSYVIEVKKEN